MHGTEIANGTVPAFLVKLWKLVDDSSCDNLISWSEHGTSFVIHNQAQFAKELLPLYFKHSNNASFIRQLNMYGFRKVLSIEQSGLKADGNSVEFQHPYFIMGHENLLEMIKRKVSAPKDDISRCRSEVLSQVVSDLSVLKQENEDLRSQIAQKDHEREVVWRELANLKQKYRNHQQMLNKLFHFLVNIVPSNRGMNRGVKRKIPLMIENSRPAEKLRRASISSVSDDYPLDTNSGNGPVIHDITDSCSPRSLSAATLSPSPTVPNVDTVSETDLPPPSADLDIDSTLNISSSVFDPLDSHIPDSNDFLGAITSELGINNKVTDNQKDKMKEHSYSQSRVPQPGTSTDEKNDMSVAIADAPCLHIPEENTMKDIDWLKDQLMTSGGYNIDPSYFLNLFSQDDARKSNTFSRDEMKDSNEVQGNEVVQCGPSLSDLSLFDIESAMAPSQEDYINDDLDNLLSLNDVNDETSLHTPEVSVDKIIKFSQPTAAKTDSSKGPKKVKTYAKKKSV